MNELLSNNTSKTLNGTYKRLLYTFILFLGGTLITLAGVAKAKDKGTHHSWRSGTTVAKGRPGAVLASELRKSRRDQEQIDKDIDALLNKLDKDSSFASRLRESLLKHDASTAAKLVQSVSVSKVSVMFESQGGKMRTQVQAMYKGHICWYRNGVRKCLWYSQC